MNRLLIIMIIGLCFSSCEKIEKKKVLYLSHSRLCTGIGPDIVDERLENIDFENFNLVIHGGDVLCETSKHPERLAYSDSVFRFSDDKTLWVKGNHDIEEKELLKKITSNSRPWKSKTVRNTHFLVLDYLMMDSVSSSEELIEVLGEFPLKSGDQLVILTHYLYWLYGHPELIGQDKRVSNVRICEEFDWCLKKNDFMELVYPELLGFENDGIDVICLAGDMGVKRKTFEYIDQNGVTFLGCGLNNKSPQDSVLIFTKMNEDLSWDFVSLNDLK